jgi:hypothetical protein
MYTIHQGIAIVGYQRTSLHGGYMPKVEIEMELGGFKIDSFKVRIKADREDIPRISGEIGKQFPNLLRPPAALIDEPVRKQVPSVMVTPINDGGSGNGRGKGNRRNKGGSGSTNGGAISEVVTWQHDVSKWGAPKQGWKAGQKVLWLLYVIKNEVQVTELTAANISDTFAAKFKHSGTLKKTSMPSIMKSLATNDPVLVMCDAAKVPNTWYLSDEGAKAAEKLVVEARTPAESQQPSA